MIVYQSTLEQLRSLIKIQAQFDIIDSVRLPHGEVAAINMLYLPLICHIMQAHHINLNGLYLLKPIPMFLFTSNRVIGAEVVLHHPINRPNTTLDKRGIDYTIWLESEAMSAEFRDQFNDTLDAINMCITFADGDEFAFTVETFDFYYLRVTTDAEYVLFESPDILIRSLDRPTIERMVNHLIVHQQLDTRFLTDNS